MMASSFLTWWVRKRSKMQKPVRIKTTGQVFKLTDKMPMSRL